MPSALAIQESIGHYTGYSGILQPHTGPKAALSTSRSKTRKARPADRFAPVGGCSSRTRGMEPAKRQVTNRKVASVSSGCQWGSFLR
jgi:hypothetical protein